MRANEFLNEVNSELQTRVLKLSEDLEIVITELKDERNRFSEEKQRMLTAVRTADNVVDSFVEAADSAKEVAIQAIKLMAPTEDIVRLRFDFEKLLPELTFAAFLPDHDLNPGFIEITLAKVMAHFFDWNSFKPSKDQITGYCELNLNAIAEARRAVFNNDLVEAVEVLEKRTKGLVRSSTQEWAKAARFIAERELSRDTAKGNLYIKLGSLLA